MQRFETEPRWFRNRVRVALDSATWVMTQNCRQAWHYNKDIWVWCKMLLFICHPQHHFWSSQTPCVSVYNPRCCFFIRSSNVSDSLYKGKQCLFSQDNIPASLLRGDSPKKDTHILKAGLHEKFHLNVCEYFFADIKKPAFHSSKGLVWIMFDTTRLAPAKLCHNMTDQLVLYLPLQRPQPQLASKDSNRYTGKSVTEPAG